MGVGVGHGVCSTWVVACRFRALVNTRGLHTLLVALPWLASFLHLCLLLCGICAYGMSIAVAWWG